MFILINAFLIGTAFGLRALIGIAAVSWAARYGILRLDHTWLAFLGHAFTPYILTLIAIGELVNDKLPKTPTFVTLWTKDLRYNPLEAPRSWIRSFRLLHLEICQQSRPWECGNPEGISKECGKGGKPVSESLLVALVVSASRPWFAS